MPSEMPQIWSRIEPEFLDRLDEEARVMQVNRSMLIRLAILRLFADIDQSRRRGGSPDFVALAAVPEREAIPA